MATAMRMLTRLNRSSTAKQWLSNFLSRRQLNAEFRFNQLACSDRADACKFLERQNLSKAFYFAGADLYRDGAVPIRFPKKSRRNIVRQTSRDGAPVQRLRDSTRVRLR